MPLNRFVPAVLIGAACTWLPSLARAAEPPPPSAADGLIASPEPDWPQWRGPCRDGISRERGLRPEWPAEGPPLLWKLGGLGQGWSSPIVVGDRLYITGDVDDDLAIFAYDLRGVLQWRATNGKSWTGSFPGARACCAFSEGRLYHLNAHGRLACLDPATGRELWAVDVLARFEADNITWALSECLLVDGPRVIVTPGGAKGFMAALDKSDGRTVWTSEPVTGAKTSYCSPILFRHAGRRLLATCSSKHGCGVDADSGKLLWTVPLENPHGVNTSTPIYGGGRLFYVTAYTPAVQYRLKPDGGSIRPEEAWTHGLDTVTGSGVLVDGVLHAAGYRKQKWWLSVDWLTGRTLGEQKSVTTGAALYADGRLYCLAEDGTAAMLKPTSAGLELAGRFRLYPDRTRDAWAHPVLLDGRLYLRYHDTLWCYGVR